MSRLIDEADRSQGTLLPETIDEYVSEENPVRVIDAFAGALDLPTLGFEGVEAEATGRPAYHPATMLKIYLYGYLNRIQFLDSTAQGQWTRAHACLSRLFADLPKASTVEELEALLPWNV